MGEEIYQINPDRCTECIGHFDEPQCQVLCPVSCIPQDPDRPETVELLWAKFTSLQSAKSA